MEVDKDRLLSLIGEIEQALSILREYGEADKESLIGNLKSLGSVKYYLIVAIEGCVDICNHIVAKERIGVPESYSDCFKILKNNEIISDVLSKELSNLAKFRNLLVHLYWKVDDEKVYELLQMKLDDIGRFIQQISKKYL